MPNIGTYSSTLVRSGSLPTLESSVDREFMGEKAMEYAANNGCIDTKPEVKIPVPEAFVKALEGINLNPTIADTKEALGDLIFEDILGRKKTPLGKEGQTGIDFKAENAKVQAANLVTTSAERIRQGIAAATAERENNEDKRYKVAGLSAEQRAKVSGLLQLGVQATEFIRNAYTRAFTALKESWQARKRAATATPSSHFETAKDRATRCFTQMNMASERSGGQHALSAVG